MTYALSTERAMFKCHMAYTPGGYVVCEITGVESSCLTTVVEKLNLSKYVSVGEGPKLYISTEIHTVGKTVGEIIKEIATATRLC